MCCYVLVLLVDTKLLGLFIERLPTFVKNEETDILHKKVQFQFGTNEPR